MSALKIIIVGLLLTSVGGCGVDKFLLKRSVNQVESSVSETLNEYADLNAAQQLQVDTIAVTVDGWLKATVLPRAADLIGALANDLALQQTNLTTQTGAGAPSVTLNPAIYDAIVEFAYRPARVSENTELVAALAQLFFNMSPAQDAQVRAQLEKDFKKRQSRRDKSDLEDQKKNIARFTGLIFRGLGAKRSGDEMQQMREILDARLDLSEQKNTVYKRVNQTFFRLANEKGDSLPDFTERYKNAWALLEDGPSTAYPVLFKANADNGYDALNALFKTLNLKELANMIKGLREYEAFMLELAQG